MLYLFMHIGCSRLGDMPSNSLGAIFRRRLKDTAFRPGKVGEKGRS